MLYILAIPSLNLPMISKQVINERSKRLQVKEQKELVASLLIQTENLPSNKELITNIGDEDNIKCLPSTSKQTPYEILFQKFSALQKDNEKLQYELESNKREIGNLSEKNRQLQVTVTETEKKLDVKVRAVLADFLSPNQIDILLKKKTKARWNSDEISKAFTLRYFSKRAYIYVRQSLKYPLPGISTLQSWASNVDLQHGILKDILKVMQVCGKEKTDFEKITVLSYDEVKVASLIEYDQKYDEIIGPCKYMQVIMARGLFSTWKQPVFIGFDTKMKNDLLKQVIIELNKINYEVVACVSDCGGGNIGLWKEMNISIEKTSFNHPVTNNDIYVFADVPHVLKLIRNWFLDYGFILGDETVITKEPVKCLIEDSRSEISSCYKLNHLHITCERAQRQNVALAAQLMSNTTATALKRYLPGPNKQLAANVADFIDIINKWFDIMNSYIPSATLITKLPYGKKLEIQDEVLEKAKQLFRTMRARSKNALQIFQKGAIISTISLQKLFTDLKERYGIHYILTHRLNQDCLENLFCQVIFSIH